MSGLYYYLRNGQVSPEPVPWEDIPLGADQALSARQAHIDPPPWFPIHDYPAQTAAAPRQQYPQYPPKNRWLYIILALFFGLLGFHNFYSGHGAAGAIKLLLNLFFFWTIVIPLFFLLVVLVEIFIVSSDARGIRMSWS